MKKIVISVITFTIFVSSASAIECKKESKDFTRVSGINSMFEEGKASGQLRTMYIKTNFENAANTHATAVGGFLKYETAKYGGVNFGLTMNYTEDINALSGDTSNGERSDELSSTSSTYSQLSEAYIAYESCLFDYTLGRQIIDTPLADSDDIRMAPNSFEAFVINYPSDKLNVTLGYLSRWQGYDGGLDDAWVKTGKNGTSFVGASYEDGVETSLWYYNISEQNSAIYADIAYFFKFTKNTSLTTAAQYLNENEINDSGYEANIYGVSVELVLSDLSLALNYNTSSKELGKSSFSGFGGGTLFTNMETMIIDEITEDREASSFVGVALYNLGDFSFLYAYGDFKGKANSLGAKAHIVEQDVSIGYNLNDKLVAYVMYVDSKDKIAQVSSGYDWKKVQAMVNYNF